MKVPLKKSILKIEKLFLKKLPIPTTVLERTEVQATTGKKKITRAAIKVLETKAKVLKIFKNKSKYIKVRQIQKMNPSNNQSTKYY